MSHRFVGFGFGPIQSGLFLLEAFRSGNFDGFVVAEVDQSLVDAVNGNGGRYTVNIAHPDHIERCEVSGVRMLNPRVVGDRAELVKTVKQCDELATALPSVKFYDGDQASVISVVADALREGVARAQVLYAAENHNHAAEIFTDALAKRTPPDSRAKFQAVNTVIGKMSGVITGAEEIEKLGLSPMTPGATKAVLVEEFNRILISRITLDGVVRGINVFQEKNDLLPFEEAKLYGHNAIHALIGYLANERGMQTMAEVSADAHIMDIARQAFLKESGVALCSKYSRLGDPLFTQDGFRAYAEDLLSRMVNPNLNDLVQRVIRDPQRKLSWSDRIYGTMRLVLEQGIVPRQLAVGAAAGVRFWLGAAPKDESELAAKLKDLWGPAAGDEVAGKLISLTWQAMGGAS